MANKACRHTYTAALICAIILGSVTIVSCATPYGPLSSGQANMGGKADDEGYSLKLTRDTGLIFAGTTMSLGSGGSDLWLIKTGLSPYTMDNGVTGAFQREQWNTTVGGTQDDAAYAVIQTADGGFATAGYTCSFGAGGKDAWLVKVSSDGSLQWKKTFGGAGDDAANCLIQTSDGGYMLGGYTNSVSSQAAWVIKTDASGDSEWTKTYVGKSANSLIAAGDGGFVFAVEYSDAFGLLKIDSLGSPIVEKKFDAPNVNAASARSVIEAYGGGYLIAGWVKDNNLNQTNTWIVKTDPVGQLQWNKTPSNLAAFDIIKTASGGYALTGERAFLLLMDAEGNVELNQIHDGNPSNDTRYADLYPTSMRSIIEASPNHFVMVGYHKGGSAVNMQLAWVHVALKSGEQTIPPQTTLISPGNATYNQRNVPLTFYVNEPIKYQGASLNGLNTTILGNTTLNLPDGSYRVTVISTDFDHNTAPSQTVYFNVDSPEPYVPPKVTIESPTSQTYNTSHLRLNFTTDQQAFWKVYSLDGGTNVTAFSGSQMPPITNGIHTLTVYAGNLANGPAGSAKVTFTVDAHPEYRPTMPYPSTNTSRYEVYPAIAAIMQPVLLNAIWISVAWVCVLIATLVAIVIYNAKKTPKQLQQHQAQQ